MEPKHATYEELDFRLAETCSYLGLPKPPSDAYFTLRLSQIIKYSNIWLQQTSTKIFEHDLCIQIHNICTFLQILAWILGM